MTSYSSARVYYELFDGVPDEDRICALTLSMMIGGTEAPLSGDRYWVSVYGRRSINGANLVTIHQENINLPVVGSVGVDPSWRYWRTVNLSKGGIDEQPVRCIVVKVEALLANPAYVPRNTSYVPQYADQSTSADPPPWGIRIKKARVYASDLKRNITVPRILADIVEPYYVPSSPGSSLQYDQVAFTDLPLDRWDALDDICAMTGWDYYVWDESLSFAKPGSGGALSVPKDHPGVSWEHGPDESDAYNAVRVQYTNKRGRPREVIVHGTLRLGGDVVADTIRAPDSVQSKAGALRVARRWLRAHGRIPDVGDVTVTGQGPWGDALKLRPGRMLGKNKVAHVTLNPLDWSATLQFGANVDSYEAWLARLAAGAHPKRR